MGKIKEFLIHEGRLVLLVTAYFLVCFGLIALLKTLILHEYAIETAAAGKAVFGALVIAKVVIVLDKTKFGNRFERHAVWSSVVYKTVVYTAVVATVLVAEKLFHAWREGSQMGTVMEEVLRSSDGDRAMATTLCVFVSFIGYNLLSEVGRAFGWDRLLTWLVARHDVRGEFGPAPPD